MRLFWIRKEKYKNLEIAGDSNLVTIEGNNSFSRDVTIDVTKGGKILIGKNNAFLKGVLLMTYGGNITIGNDCSFNPYTILYGHGGLQIGNQVRVAAHCVLIPANHVFTSLTEPIFKQGLTRQGIVLEDNIWLGAGVKVLDGVKISSGVVVAAGAVVNSNLERDNIYGGVPAKLIRQRI